MRWGTRAATMLTGINSKSTKDLNVGAKSIKLLQGNIGVTLSGFGLGDGFLDIAPKAQEKNRLIGLYQH